MAIEMQHLHAVIIAGGSGTRLWPLSRKNRPKQFMKIGGDQSLIDRTVDRVASYVPRDQRWVVCGSVHAQIIFDEIESIRADQVLVEPQAKNTAPAIAFAAKALIEKDPDAIMMVMPADHFVPQSDYGIFQNSVKAAYELALQNKLVTFGLKPSFPSTGFGYIERAIPLKVENTFSVKKFHEKPDFDRAEQYYRDADYYWNSGIFLWKASFFLEELAKSCPEVSHAFEDFKLGDENRKVTAFAKAQDISVDYAVLEKSQAVAVVEAHFAWSDVGSLDALSEFVEQDESKNSLSGDIISLESQNNLVIASSRFVGMVGVSDLCVIETENAVLILPKDKVQSVKQLVEELKSKNRQDLL